MAKRKSVNSLTGRPVAKARVAPPASRGSEEAEHEVSNGTNINYMTRLQEAVKHIADIDGRNNMFIGDPVPITRGGIMTPYTNKACVAALQEAGTYVCGGNVMWLDVFANIWPGVLMHGGSIDLLVSRYLCDGPARLPGAFIIGVLASEVPMIDQLKGKLSGCLLMSNITLSSLVLLKISKSTREMTSAK